MRSKYHHILCSAGGELGSYGCICTVVTKKEKGQLDKIYGLVQEWVDKKGHERCWYYPDLFKSIVEVLQISPSFSPNLPTKEEFEEGCRRYQDEQYKA